MKEKITAFIQGLISYDYILFASAFTLFILLIVASILLRRKVGLSIFVLLLSFSVLFLGPTIGYIKMHQFLFKNSVTLTSQNKLNFVQAIVVKGTLKNESNFDFKSCKITASVCKSSRNKIRNYIYSFKPLANMSIFEKDIPKGESREFKMIVEPFTYSKDYNISIKSECEL
jgi:hypothetical protein